MELNSEERRILTLKSTLTIPKAPKDLGLIPKFSKWFPGQKEALEGLLQSNKKFLLLEAPTGSGKTLIGTALHKMEQVKGTVYCCTSKQLQEQYMDDFREFAVDLKGRNNYPCPRPGVENAASCIDNKEDPCPLKDGCEYRLRVEEARYAELAVLNTWALLFQIHYAGRFTKLSSRKDEPPRKILILDEADAIDDVLMDFASLTISAKYCKKYYLPKPDFKREEVEYWKLWIEKALMLLEGFISRAPTEEDKNALRVAEGKLSFLAENLNDSWVVDKGPEPTSVSIVPTDTRTLAHKHVFRHFDKVIMMSASFCGDKIFTELTGIPPEEYDYFVVPSYFPANRRPIYYTPTAYCSRKHENEGSYELIIEAIDRLLTVFSTEQTIIHTVSKDRANQLVDRGNNYHHIRLYSSDEKESVTLFREKKIRVLASPSLERGYDFPDDACRINIVSKIPKPYWGSKSVQAKSRANSNWYSWKTVQRLVQMTGRSTRKPTDYSLSFILDKDFLTLYRDDGGDKLLPNWWKDAKRRIDLKDITRELLEEASR